MITIIAAVLIGVCTAPVLAEGLQPDDILAVVNQTGTNIQSEVERLVRLSPRGLSDTNSVVVFKHGPRLRPSLRSLAESPEEELSCGAQQWLACIRDHRDLDLIHKSNWLRVSDRDISDSSLDAAIAQTMNYIVEREKDQLRPPEEKFRCINATGTAAFATCETSSRSNNHGRCQVMYFSKEGDKWTLRYYDLVWIE